MGDSSETSGESRSDKTPLVVDLDGALVHSDLLHEAYFASVANGPVHHARTVGHLARGKAALKSYLARQSTLDFSTLPYNGDVLALVSKARADGRPVYLATASDTIHAQGVAAHLGFFEGVFCSDGQTNLSGRRKAEKLIEAFGERGFDYLGDSSVDLEVWAHARRAHTVGASANLRRRVEMLRPDALHIETVRPGLVWLKVLRVHQYAKNILVFLAMFTSHTLTLSAFLQCVAAFLAFSFCASAVYVINDLIDLDADRRHPTKHKRPFASGAVPILHGVIAAPVLLALAFACAFSVSPLLAAVLGGYFLLTSAYSISLKRKMIVDVIVLASLYTIRVIGGAAAIRVVPSEWLLAFSMFFFTFLALIKRYVELDGRSEKGLGEMTNRNYLTSDLSIVATLAAASGFNAVTIFALYVSSRNVQLLYHHPVYLWLICPMLMYWIGRVTVMAHRRLIDDDPIVFALRDWRSYLMVLAIGCVLYLAA